MFKMKQPRLCVDVICRVGDKIVLVERAHEPFGFAIPGGFVDYGETLEKAAARELKEETGLVVRNLRQFRAYSDPKRDPRGHTVGMVFIGDAKGTPKGGDDAKSAALYRIDDLPRLAFDHGKILRDYIEWLGAPGASCFEPNRRREPTYRKKRTRSSRSTSA
jgi:ADP-ribose pyrophosphatase YjhB (NUDIX family)